jgi:hypothetical protein
MDFKKETMTREVWVMNIGGQKIPLEAVSALIKSIAITVLLVLTWNIAQTMTFSYLEWNGFFNGNCNAQTHICQPCWIEQTGATSMSWKCINTTDSRPGLAYMDKYKNLAPLNQS